MEYPTLKITQKSRQVSDAFLGYNHNLRISDSEFYDMENMTSDYYPVLSPRGKRGTYKEGVSLGEYVGALGMIEKDDRVCYVDGTAFMYGDERIEMELTVTDPPHIKTLVSMGAYIIIMPDRKYINTVKAKPEDDYEWGSIDAIFLTDSEATFEMCTLTGDPYQNVTASSTAPESPENGKLWIDTSSKPHALKRYASSSGMWVSVSTTYIKITSTGIGSRFSQYDGVKISGLNEGTLKDLNGSHVLYGCGDDYIIIAGFLDETVRQPPEAECRIAIERMMPEVDFLIESGNRLWGCRYGMTADGNVVNEIYASKLGDFKNWNCYMNLSTDSYTASCGSDGRFTGAITHMGYPLFFKENCMHKVFGNYPANFQIQHTPCRGVQSGSGGSLAIVNETLYYKSPTGVCAYDGSLPVEISSVFGEERYSSANAGAFGNKYYISMLGGKNAQGNPEYNLFVYDTAKGLWHKEDRLHVAAFCNTGENLFMQDETGRILSMRGGYMHQNEIFPWMVETGMIGMSLPDMKYISRLLVRMSLDFGTMVEIRLQYDSIGDWEFAYRMTANSTRSFAIPIRPRRCDHFRIRIEGIGQARIFSITKTIEQGSDVS